MHHGRHWLPGGRWTASPPWFSWSSLPEPPWARSVAGGRAIHHHACCSRIQPLAWSADDAGGRRLHSGRPHHSGNPRATRARRRDDGDGAGRVSRRGGLFDQFHARRLKSRHRAARFLCRGIRRGFLCLFSKRRSATGAGPGFCVDPPDRCPGGAGRRRRLRHCSTTYRDGCFHLAVAASIYAGCTIAVALLSLSVPTGSGSDIACRNRGAAP